jgi:hypothetical protein
MEFYPFITNLKWYGSATLLAGSMVLSLPAQEQPIIFSAPKNADPALGGNTALPVNPSPNNDTAPDDTSAYSALAPSIFQSGPAGFDNLPGSPGAVLSPGQISAWQKKQDRLEHWTMMTPEEILNMPTPEQMFGLPDPNANKTVEQRYWERQQQTQASGTTNSATSGSAISRALNAGINPFDPLNDQTDPAFINVSASDPFSQRSTLNPALKQTSPWASAFIFPSDIKPTTTQQLADLKAKKEAEMDRFRELLGSIETPTPATPAPLATLGTPTTHFGSDDDSFSQKRYDILGRPIQSVPLSQPTGLKPLTEPIGYYQAPPDAKKPDWEAHLPPWLSAGPPSVPTPR